MMARITASLWGGICTRKPGALHPNHGCSLIGDVLALVSGSHECERQKAEAPVSRAKASLGGGTYTIDHAFKEDNMTTRESPCSLKADTPPHVARLNRQLVLPSQRLMMLFLFLPPGRDEASMRTWTFNRVLREPVSHVGAILQAQLMSRGPHCRRRCTRLARAFRKFRGIPRRKEQRAQISARHLRPRSP
ncbi:hypothetical protein BD414DRAFT_478144 [Trametes punicea]|nr:hypothetical protein BD414DRAFT_478144 [Trametes punicea]